MRQPTSMSPGNGNAALYLVHRSPDPTLALERKLKVAELLLRLLICVSASLAALIIATDSQTRTLLGLQKKAKYTLDNSLVYLVVTNGIIASYSLVHLVRCALGFASGTVVLNKAFAWAIFCGDQVMAYLSLSAMAAAIQSGAIAKLGQSELQWVKICDLFGRFCNQGAGGGACAVVAALCGVLLSSISAYSLFRLFGGTKPNNNGSW